MSLLTIVCFLDPGDWWLQPISEAIYHCGKGQSCCRKTTFEEEKKADTAKEASSEYHVCPRQLNTYDDVQCLRVLKGWLTSSSRKKKETSTHTCIQQATKRAKTE